jgi:hypothetical protein
VSFLTSFLATFTDFSFFLAVGLAADLDFRWARAPEEAAATNSSKMRKIADKRRAEHIDFMFYLSEMDFLVGFEESRNSSTTDFYCAF